MFIVQFSGNLSGIAYIVLLLKTHEIKDGGSNDMKTRSIYWVALTLLTPALYATAVDIDLGTADAFAVLAGSTVTNTGPTAITGELGVWPGTAVTGFPPGVVTGGSIHSGDAVAQQAQSDLTTAYNFAAGQACDTELTGQDLGGLTLTPGVYCFDTSAGLTGTLTLDSQGDDSAVFLFQIGSTLTTASASSVIFTGELNRHVYWQVGSSATLGTTTAFAGNILALTSITLNTGATIECGRALARNGAVTMDTNEVSFNAEGCQDEVSAVPEPSSAGLVLVAAVSGLLWRRRGCFAGRARS